MAGRPATPVLVGAIALAVSAVSTAAVLIRLATAPPLVIAFWRLAFATLILAPAAFAVPSIRREMLGQSVRDDLALTAVGVVLAIHFAAWITSLSLTSVAASVVLVTLHPVLVGVASAWLFDEGLGGKGWVGVLVAFAGGAVIAWGDASLSGHRLAGDLLALAGAGAVAAYFLAGRGFRRRLSLLAYVVPVYAVAAVTLLAMAVIADQPIAGWPLSDYLLFLALAVVPMILGHTVLNWSLKHVTAPVVATAILGEPVGASILAWLVLTEVPPLVTVVGGAVVLAGIGLVIVAARRGGEELPAAMEGGG